MKHKMSIIAMTGLNGHSWTKASYTAEKTGCKPQQSPDSSSMAVVQEESWFPEFGRAVHVIAPQSSAIYPEHEDEPGTHLMDACHVKQRRQ